jgi:hypothetical protein
MILLAFLIALVMYERWAIVHLHTTYADCYNAHFKNGDIVYHLGVRATVIDCKTTDIVLRRNLLGLLLPPNGVNDLWGSPLVARRLFLPRLR